jgi:hypothetical protein
MYLRREYIWFPLSAVGCYLGATIGGISNLGVNTIWATALAALVVKTVLFRWYGVRTFQMKIVPVVVRALMGMTLGMLLLVVTQGLIRGQGVWFK